MQAVCMKAVTKTRKREQRYFDALFSTYKNLATTQDRQTLQNSDEKHYCQYWMLRLLVTN